MAKFVLRKLDDATGGFLEQAIFSTEEFADLIKLLEVDSLRLGMRFHLDQQKFRQIADLFSVQIGRDAAHGELTFVSDGFELKPQTHTGRELLLMLEGSKPFAAFVDTYPSVSSDEIIPESYFGPHVESGTILKFEHIQEPNETIGRSLRYVMYAVPGEEWRVNAYLMLWKLTHKYGWSKGFERIEGYLLGYEDK